MSSEDGGKNPTPRDQEKANDRRRIIDLLRRRAPDGRGVGCFACAWIVDDFDRHGKLTDYPYDSNDKGLFPYLGKVAHIRAELPQLDVKVGVAAR